MNYLGVFESGGSRGVFLAVAMIGIINAPCQNNGCFKC